jgi:copper homeostasis protein
MTQQLKHPQLEIVVQDPESAEIAVRGGADRVEVCAGLGPTGGLTPSLGLTQAVAERLRGLATRAGNTPGIVVLIRPTEGGFDYDAAALDVMARDIAALGAVPGVTGLVFGVLTDHGTVDVPAMLGLIDAVRAVDAVDPRREDPLDIVFHRAVDAVAHPEELVEELVQLGCTRVLTSGGAGVAGDGVLTIAAMVAAADHRIEVMAGGGVVAEDVPALLGAGVDAVHLSAKRQARTAASGPGGGTAYRWVTEANLVAEAAAAVGGARLNTGTP